MHDKLRNRLNRDKVSKLVYIKTNSNFLQKTEKLEEDEDMEFFGDN